MRFHATRLLLLKGGRGIFYTHNDCICSVWGVHEDKATTDKSTQA